VSSNRQQEKEKKKKNPRNNQRKACARTLHYDYRLPVRVECLSLADDLMVEAFDFPGGKCLILKSGRDHPIKNHYNNKVQTPNANVQILHARNAS
jgi:hypothetical protein